MKKVSGNSNTEKNYELRPKFNAKFTKEKVYGIIKSILDEKMEYFQGEYDHQKALDLNKRIVDDVKEQLGGGKLNINRYEEVTAIKITNFIESIKILILQTVWAIGLMS